MIKIASLFALILFSMSFASAQSAIDGFDPNADSTVRAVDVQPDGKILIGGNFTTVLGVTRNRIARLDADGTLDTTTTTDRPSRPVHIHQPICIQATSIPAILP